MKKFKFSLEKLLQIRSLKEEESRVELAKASADYQIEVNKINDMKENITKTRHQLSAGKKMSLHSLQQYDRLISKSEMTEKSLQPVINQKKQVMNRKLADYSEAKKNKRAVEILKEKAYNQYIEEENLEEQKTMDEIGKNVYIRHQADPDHTDK